MIYPPRTNADGTRRRSSVWSSMTVSPGSSPDGKRSTLLNLFSRKSNTAEPAPVGGNEDARDGCDEVDSEGKKKDDGE